MEFQARRPDNPALLRYMADQGYPNDGLPIKRWGLRELTLAAFFYHPDLAVARARWHAAQAGQVTAGQRLNPTISGSGEHHSRHDGISPWTIGLALDIPVETGGKRQLRSDRAASLSEAARINIGQEAWKIRSRVHAHLIEYQSAMCSLELFQQEVSLYEEIVQMLQKRRAAGMVSDIELGEAKLAQQKAQLELANIKSRMPELRAALASASGFPLAAFNDLSLETDLPAPPPASQLPTADIQRSALLNRLDIRSALARYDAAEAKVRLEIARQYPDLVLSPGYSFDQGDNRWSLGISMILALLDKNEGPIAEANAQRELEARQFEALQIQVIGEEQAALAHYRAALAEQAHAEQLAAAQRAMLARTHAQYSAGYIDRLEFTLARLETGKAQQSELSARVHALQALSQLEDAMQRPLAEPALSLPEQQESKEMQP